MVLRIRTSGNCTQGLADLGFSYDLYTYPAETLGYSHTRGKYTNYLRSLDRRWGPLGTHIPVASPR